MRTGALAFALAAVLAVPANAEKITVSQYGRIIATLPWAVALEKGMFKEAGLDIDGITSGAGGGTSVRNMLAGSFPVAEVSTTAAIAALKAGVDLRMVASNSNHIGELAWATKPDSGYRSIRDLAGKKIGFSNPKSTTEAILRAAVDRAGLVGKVELLSMGGLGPGLTALAQGAIAAAPLNDPQMTLEPKKYAILFYGHEVFPQYSWSMTVTTREFAEKNRAKVQALVRVHKKAVDFVYANPGEAAKVYAKIWETKVEEAEAILPKYYNWRHWSRGDFNKGGLDALADGMRLVGDLDGPFDWSKVIDQSFLDEDLRRPL
jgi:NitT/TauT family transport system substrate-binding protein